MENVNQSASGPRPGELVMVRWSDGSEYQGQVAAVQGDQVLCRFPNGNEAWVSVAVVRPAPLPVGAESPLGAPAASAPQKTAPNKAHAGLFVALAVAGAIVTLLVTAILIRGKSAWPLSMFDEDAAVVAYAMDASDAVLAVAVGKPHDAKWNGSDPKDDLRATEASLKKELGGAEPKVALIAIILGATRPNGQGHQKLQGQAVVVNGALRWFSVSRDEFPFPPSKSRQGLEGAEPLLADAGRRLLQAMGKDCSLPMVTPEELATLPANLQRDLLKNTSKIPTACDKGEVASDWQPHVEGIGVMVEAGGQWVSLQSSLEVAEGKIRLGRVRARPVEGPQTENASAPAASAAPPEPPSAGAVSVGGQVNISSDKGGFPVTVVELYGKLAKYSRNDGIRNWEYLSKTTPAGTPLPDPVGHTCSVLVGQRVKVLWPYDKTNRKYLVRVGEVYGRMARVVHPDDGALQWVTCEEAEPVF